MWTKSSGLVGSEEGDELYARVLGTKVCRSNTFLGCVALVWRQISNVVERRRCIPVSDKNQTILLVLPDCEDMYQYHNLVTLQAAMDFSSELCQHLGTDFSIKLFHPKYKNAPRLLNPPRHSPFPCLGLHFVGKPPNEDPLLVLQRRKRRRVSFEEQVSDEVSALKESRQILEMLFNSAAATSPEDSVVLLDHDLRGDEENLDARRAREVTERWITLSVLEGGADKALRYAGTEGHRWTITKSTAVEEIYSDMWLAITTLSETGARLEERLRTRPRPEVISSMFVTTKYCVYNAHTWRRFAITINGALKRITNGQVSALPSQNDDPPQPNSCFVDVCGGVSP